jgi:HAD superfamily hydrolase (TIGR01509 family)
VLRALLFDFNGVLVDDEPLHARLLRRVLGEEGIELAADAEASWLGRADRDCVAAALAGARGAVEPGRVARLVARKAAYYQDEVRRQGYPYFPGALELVRAAAADGLLLGVVSGALRDEVVAALAAAGVRPLFHALVTAEDVARGKPDPEGYRSALAALNAEPPALGRLVHPHEAVAIEDSAAGLAAAADAGLRTVAVAGGGAARALAPADWVVASLSELSPARLRARFDRDEEAQATGTRPAKPSS